MTSENLITAPEGTDLKKAELIFKKNKIEKLPVVNKQGRLIGLITFGDILKLKSHPNSAKDEFRTPDRWSRRGHHHDIMDRVHALQQAAVDVVCLDSAHGHTRGVMDALKKSNRLTSTCRS